MIAMRAYWILPNRDQKDDILASDGETILPLRQILEPAHRPKGFSHGVPAELLARCGPEAEILFAQKFPHWNGGKQLVCVSTTAGHDASGRVVHLGLLFILDPGERPRFDLPYAGLSEQDRFYASALIHRLASPGPGDSWAQSVRDLFELPPASGPAANVELQRSTVPFHSLYMVGPGGPIRKAAIRIKLRRNAVVFFILIAVAGAWLSARACERSLRPAVLTGVVTWRFN